MRAACLCLALVALGGARVARAASPEERVAGAARPGAPALAAFASGARGPAPHSSATPSDRDAARALAKQGYTLFESGDFRGALDAFTKAEERFHAPPHQLYIARAQAKLGALLAAKQTYESIVAETLAEGAPPPFREAQATARAELDELDRRIPSLHITLSGAAAAGATVTVDGAKIAPRSLGQALPQDPGQHTVVVMAPGSKRVERAVQLKDGGSVERVAVTLDPPAVPSALPPLLAFSVGGLGLAAGGVTLGIAIAYSGPTSPYDVRPLETASLVSFIVGGAGVAAGVTLVILRSSGPSPSTTREAPRVEAQIGPSSFAIVGRF